MSFKIIEENEAHGMVTVEFYDGDKPLCTTAVNIPYEAGEFIGGQALVDHIMQMYPHHLVEHKAAMAAIGGFAKVRQLEQYSAPPVLDDLEEAKLKKREDIKDYREYAATRKVAFNGKTFTFGRSGVTLMHLMAFAIPVSFGADAQATIDWRDDANNSESMTRRDAMQLLSAFAARNQYLFEQSQLKKAEVDACTTIAEVNAVTWQVDGITPHVGAGYQAFSRIRSKA